MEYYKALIQLIPISAHRRKESTSRLGATPDELQASERVVASCHHTLTGWHSALLGRQEDFMAQSLPSLTVANLVEINHDLNLRS